MIEHVTTVGDTGRLKIVDRTDESSKLVELWVQSLSPIAIPQLPWSYSIDGVRSSWMSFNFQNTTMWQKLSVVYGGTAKNITLHLGNTGTSQLDGPSDFSKDLYGYVAPVEPEDPTTPTDPTDPVEPEPIIYKAVDIMVGNVAKKAYPYVNVNGVWKRAVPYARGANGWQTTV